MDSHGTARSRRQLDNLFFIDAIFSVVFGVSSLLAPHGFMTRLGGGEYNRSAHETLRLYGCLRISLGYILLRLRSVDDGMFRKSVCESLFLCYFLQMLAILRTEFTSDSFAFINWIAITVLAVLGGCYGSFRFGKGGDWIKVYELPVNSSKASR
mmetsp:Transcript_9103/g.12633  ORF Transcript_9103/g.12633 Transcript_9103/m.12633 type:complete len:154 (-) Transcript_9103:368-829(-)